MNPPAASEYEYVELLVNEAIIDAIKDGKCGAANVADLRCAEVLWCIPTPGTNKPYWSVEVEEASPNDSTLSTFIQDYFNQKGIKRIVVNTEW